MGVPGKRRIHVQVMCAWPRLHEAVELLLDEGATVADAMVASRMTHESDSGYALFGERADPETVLRDGDRVEVLRPLQVDPKQARRRRAEAAKRR